MVFYYSKNTKMFNHCVKKHISLQYISIIYSFYVTQVKNAFLCVDRLFHTKPSLGLSKIEKIQALVECIEQIKWNWLFKFIMVRREHVWYPDRNKLSM